MMALRRSPRPLLGWRVPGAHSLAGVCFLSQEWALRPLISSSAPPAGLGQQLCPQAGLYAVWPTLLGTPAPLTSWHWQWQEQQTAFPGHSAPSTHLVRPERERGAPWPGWSLGPLALGLTPLLWAAGCAPSRSCCKSSYFYTSWPSRVAVLIWADSSCLQRAPWTSRGDAGQEAHPPSPPRFLPATKGPPAWLLP